jgi:hypothetical protein
LYSARSRSLIAAALRSRARRQLHLPVSDN